MRVFVALLLAVLLLDLVVLALDLLALAGRDVAQHLVGHTSATMTDRYWTITDQIRALASAALEGAIG